MDNRSNNSSPKLSAADLFEPVQSLAQSNLEGNPHQYQLQEHDASPCESEEASQESANPYEEFVGELQYIDTKFNNEDHEKYFSPMIERLSSLFWRIKDSTDCKNAITETLKKHQEAHKINTETKAYVCKEEIYFHTITKMAQMLVEKGQDAVHGEDYYCVLFVERPELLGLLTINDVTKDAADSIINWLNSRVGYSSEYLVEPVKNYILYNAIFLLEDFDIKSVLHNLDESQIEEEMSIISKVRPLRRPCMGDLISNNRLPAAVEEDHGLLLNDSIASRHSQDDDDRISEGSFYEYEDNPPAPNPEPEESAPSSPLGQKVYPKGHDGLSPPRSKHQ